ncbi:hypothetical protein HO543_08545 [Streptococcus suis]|nr:hypothetical protein [Streptococcus suis]NQJ77344.1 hypothetical protein [Streptococcus suis]
MKVKVSCIVPLSQKASISFKNQLKTHKNIDSTSSASISNNERYTTLQEDNQFLSQLFTQHCLDSFGNTAIEKNGHDTVVLHITYQTELKDTSSLKHLSESCNKFCNDYIAKYLNADSNETHYLWVNRTLVVDNFEADIIEKLSHDWLMTENDVQTELEKYKYILCWGNNLMLNSFLHQNELIQSLVMMQFNYIVLDKVNIELTHQMERIAKLSTEDFKVKNRELITRKSDIQKLQKNVEKVLIEFDDELINLQSFKQIFHEKIKVAWQFSVVINACRQKLIYCLSEVDAIDKELDSRANFQAEILLFIVGLFGLLSYFLDLSQIFDHLNHVKINGLEIFTSTTFGTMQSIALLISLLATLHFIIRRK